MLAQLMKDLQVRKRQLIYLEKSGETEKREMEKSYYARYYLTYC